MKQGTLKTLLAGAAAAAALAVAPPANAQGPAPVQATPFGGTFSQPLFVTAAPGQPDLVYVVEKEGLVKVVENGVQLDEPFLDLTDIVSTTGEQGLLSIAFPPDFADSSLVYAYFTNKDCDAGSGGCDIEIAEFKVKRSDPTQANEGSLRTVIQIAHRDAGNHNGGTLAFAASGKLFIATGDGGAGNDAFDNSSRKNKLLGKLLRIDPVPRKNSRRAYRIPGSNPFVDAQGKDEIFSIGLRNPFRFSIDGKLIAIGDVGQGAREEVDIVPIPDAKGADFGWPAKEGEIVGPHPERATSLPQIAPIHTYPRPVNPPDSTFRGVSVTGGLLVRDPRLTGTAFDPAGSRYLFGEAFTQPTVRSFVPDVEAQTISGLTSHSFGLGSVVGFGQDLSGAVYIASLNGTVSRLDPQSVTP